MSSWKIENGKNVIVYTDGNNTSMPLKLLDKKCKLDCGYYLWGSEKTQQLKNYQSSELLRRQLQCLFNRRSWKMENMSLKEPANPNGKKNSIQIWRPFKFMYEKGNLVVVIACWKNPTTEELPQLWTTWLKERFQFLVNRSSWATSLRFNTSNSPNLSCSV